MLKRVIHHYFVLIFKIDFESSGEVRLLCQYEAKELNGLFILLAGNETLCKDTSLPRCSAQSIRKERQHCVTVYVTVTKFRLKLHICREHVWKKANSLCGVYCYYSYLAETVGQHKVLFIF